MKRWVTTVIVFFTLVAGALAINIPGFGMQHDKLAASDVQLVEGLFTYGVRFPTADEEVFTLADQLDVPFGPDLQFTFLLQDPSLTRTPQAIYLPNTTDSLSVRLNGAPLTQETRLQTAFAGQSSRSAVIPVPDRMLHPGINRAGILTNMSRPEEALWAVYAGPEERLRAFADHRQRLTGLLKLGLTLTAGLALSGLLISVLPSHSQSRFLGAGIGTLATLFYVITPDGGSHLRGGLLVVILAGLLWQVTHHVRGPQPVRAGLLAGAILSIIVAIVPLTLIWATGIFTSNFSLLSDVSHSLWLLGFCLFAVTLTISGLADIRRNIALARAEIKSRDETIAVQQERLLDEIRQKAVLEERQRFTRDIHDGIGGQLISLLMRVRSGKADLSDVEKDVQAGLSDLRVVADSLDSIGESLGSALAIFHERIRHQLASADIELQWYQAAALDHYRLDARETLHLLRLFQEGVTNILRHSGAKKAAFWAGMQGSGDQLLLTLSDDGAGGSEETRRAGKGLRNMQTRAEKLGGTLTTGSSEHGYKVELVIPVNKPVDNPD